MGGEDTQQLAEMLLAEAKAARRRATILVQMAARLREAVESDSPKEGTRHDRNSRSTE